MSSNFGNRIPRVPPEVIHLILTSADKPTLSSCSLVSHGWLGMTRPRLFEEVVWRLRPEHFLKTEENDNLHGGAYELHYFLRFLQSLRFLLPTTLFPPLTAPTPPTAITLSTSPRSMAALHLPSLPTSSLMRSAIFPLSPPPHCQPLPVSMTMISIS